MPALELNKPGEKKKLIIAAALGLVAILFLWWTFFGFGSSGNSRATVKPPATSTAAQQQPGGRQSNNPRGDTVAAGVPIDLSTIREVEIRPSSYNAPEATRNIFAYYVPPVVVKPTPKIEQPTPPPPGMLLASVSPANAYARTGDFKLEAAGDKFTGDSRIYVDGRELPTTFISPQQLSTTVPASFIAAPGARQIMVRTVDNRLSSNVVTLSVAAPPLPQYTYVGIISPITRVGDTALVQEKANKNIVGVQRGDLLGNRFRVTSISDKELVLMDATLKIQHKLTMTEGDKGVGSPLSRPTPRVEAEDDEP
jgi:hypothetical protein